MAPRFIPSPAQIEQFNRDGYLYVPASEHGLVDPQAVQEWAKQVREWPLEKGKWMAYHEVNVDGQRQLMRTENFVDYHPDLHALLCGDHLAEILKTLSGGVSRIIIVTRDSISC
jgi:hypothetical protein